MNEIVIPPSDYAKILNLPHHEPTNPPNFGMKYSQKVIKTSLNSHKTVDTIELQNGKKITIQTQYLCGDKFTKLASLRDKFGNWIKSVLRYYSKNKTFKEFKSYNSVVGTNNGAKNADNIL